MGFRSDYYELDQFIGLQLDQDWSDEFEDPYEAAEDGIRRRTVHQLRALRQDIVRFIENEVGINERRHYFELNGSFPVSGQAFDRWLLAVQARIDGRLTDTVAEPLRAPSDFFH